MNYILYVADVESTGLDSRKNEVIELSLYRSTDGVQKTWCLQATDPTFIEADALRINGHKLEDITHQTKYGRETYRKPSEVLVEIENWIEEDACPSAQRLLVGQNISFDKEMLEQLWIRHQQKDTFPFGRRMLDIMQIQFFLDWCRGEMADSYSLASFAKKYNVKNEKSHSAESDVKATKEIFDKQVEFFKKRLG